MERSVDKRLDIYRATTGMLFFGTPFRGTAEPNQAGTFREIQSQYEEYWIQGLTLNIRTPVNETSVDLMDEFFETRHERRGQTRERRRRRSRRRRRRRNWWCTRCLQW